MQHLLHPAADDTLCLLRRSLCYDHCRQPSATGVQNASDALLIAAHQEMDNSISSRLCPDHFVSAIGKSVSPLQQSAVLAVTQELPGQLHDQQHHHLQWLLRHLQVCCHRQADCFLALSQTPCSCEVLQQVLSQKQLRRPSLWAGWCPQPAPECNVTDGQRQFVMMLRHSLVHNRYPETYIASCAAGNRKRRSVMHRCHAGQGQQDQSL